MMILATKQAQSAELNAQVNQWLNQQGLIEPEQLPHGYSCEDIYQDYIKRLKNPQAALRARMSREIAVERAKKKKALDIKPKSNEKTIRDSFNRKACIDAVLKGAIAFMGQCKVHGKTQFKIFNEGARYHCYECLPKKGAKKS